MDAVVISHLFGNINCAVFSVAFSSQHNILPLLLFSKVIFIIDFEGGGTEGVERERERERERIPSGLHAVSAEPDLGLDLTNCEITT